MAVFSKRVVLLLLGVLILLSIAVRYPLVEHERFQTDSYTMHYLAKAIVDDGQARWTIHPLSYVGYYPFSYPSGVPFLLAELADLTGLSVEVAILMSSMAFGIMFCFGVFVLARCFVSRNELALAVTFFTILGARFVDTTYWDGSARAPMVVLMILVVFSSFRASQSSQRTLVLVALLFAAGCFSTHHMAVLLVVFGIAYLLAVFEVEVILKRVFLHKRSAVVTCNVTTALMVVLIAFGLFHYFTDITMMNLGSSGLFDLNPPVVSVILNIGVSYTSQIGLITVFAALSVPDLFRRTRLSVTALYPIALIIVFLPLLGNSLYVSMLLAPFVAILGGTYILRQLNASRRKIIWATLMVFLMVSTVGLPLLSSNRWNSREYLSGERVEVDNRIFSDSVYLSKYYKDSSAICNVKTLWTKMAAISDTTFLADGIPQVVSGEKTKKEILDNSTWSNAGFPTNLYEWFVNSEEQSRFVESYVRNLMYMGVAVTNTSGGTQEFFSNHQKLIVIIDNDHPSNYVDDYSERGTVLTGQLSNASWQTSDGDKDLASYMIYASGRMTAYALQLPPK